MHDAFLSYNRVDIAAARTIAALLADAGLKIWLDTSELRPGLGWIDVIEDEMNNASGCVVLWGDQNLGNFQRKERGLAFAIREKRRDFYVINVILPNAVPPSGTLANIDTWVRFYTSLDEKDPLALLVSGIKGESNPGSVSSELPDTPAPYRGLGAFGAEDEQFFFGRSQRVEEVLDRLRSIGFVAVIGDSGAGKTSLVQAGVIPRVRRGALAGWQNCLTLIVRPGSHPLRALLVELFQFQPSTDLIRIDEHSEWVRAEPARIIECVDSALQKTRRLVIVVDRAEEIFTLTTNKNEGIAFCSALESIVTYRRENTLVICTMRLEFYRDLNTYPGIAHLISRSQVLLLQMGATDVPEVIERPASLVGAIFEKGLAQQIAWDAETDGRYPLPLLQLALDLLWRKRRGRWLTWDAYREMGGVSGALRYHADGIISGFDLSDQELAGRLLCRMVWIASGSDDRAGRRVALEDLKNDEVGDSRVATIIRYLQDGRLITIRTYASAPTAELVHDTLTTDWPWLKKLVGDDRDFLEWRQSLEAKVAEWGVSGFDGAALLRGAFLGRALSWLRLRREDLFSNETNYIIESQRAQEEESSFNAWQTAAEFQCGQWEGSQRSNQMLLPPDGELIQALRRWVPQRTTEISAQASLYLRASLGFQIKSNMQEYYRRRHTLRTQAASCLRSAIQSLGTERDQIILEHQRRLRRANNLRLLQNSFRVAAMILGGIALGYAWWEFYWSRTAAYQLTEIKAEMDACRPENAQCPDDYWNVLAQLNGPEAAIERVGKLPIMEQFQL
jgi:hypothetical protein